MMIGNAFAIEPQHDLFFGLSVLDVLSEYSLDHLNLVWEAETQDDMVGLQVLLLAALEVPF